MKHVSDIIRRIFHSGDHRKTIVGVLSRHVKTPNLGRHSLCNCKTRSVVGGAVDFLSEERRSIAVFSSAPEAAKDLCAFKDATFVFMTKLITSASK
jgi:hypothetical protein